MDYSKILNKLLTNYEYCQYEMTSKTFDDDSGVLAWLLDNKIVYIQDWKHIDDQQLYEFVNCRLNVMGINKLNETKESMSNWITSMNFVKNSMLTIGLVRQYDYILRKIGFRVILRQTNSDWYNLFVVTTDNARNLCRIKSDFWKFYTL